MIFRNLLTSIYLSILIFFSLNNAAFAQVETAIPVTDEWESGGVLLDNSDMTVEIEFKLSKKGCDSSAFGNSNHLFRYIILAKKKPLNEDRYLTFKIIYQDCYGRYICKTNNLNIGVKRKNDVWDGIQPLSDPNQDNSFRGARLIIPFSEVKLNWTKDPTKDSECYKKVVSIPSSGKKKSTAASTPIVAEKTTESGVSSTNELTVPQKQVEEVKQEAPKRTNQTRKADLRIKGPTGNILRGQKIRLELSDPTDTEWNWYEDDCDGTLLKSASSFYETTADQSTTYYAKPIVNNSNKEICLNYHIIVDSVSAMSFAAKKIIATKNGRVCPGEYVKMYQIGGQLGTAATWQWFSGKSCNGTPFFEGDTLTIEAVNSNFSFSIQAKGTFNTTECLTKDLNVITVGKDTRNITANLDTENLCPGSLVSFSISGKSIENEPNWKWYNNQNEFIGEGISIKYKVDYTNGINARLEGVCNEPVNLFKDLYVTKTSTPPSRYKTKFLDAENVQFTIKDGELLGQSKWVWYKNSIEPKNRVLRDSDTYESKYDSNLNLFVRAEGPCDTTQAIQIDSVTNQISHTFISVGYSPMNISGTQTSNAYTFTIGHINNQFGWYLRGKYAPGDAISTNLKTSNTEITNYSDPTKYYKFNGITKTTRYAGIFGLNIGFSKSFFWNLGAGYGSRQLYWGIDEYSLGGNVKTGTNYALNSTASQSGIEVETGFSLHVGAFNLGSSFNYLGIFQNDKNVKPFADATVSLGINF
ncbi:MAG: hypothetical protein ACKOXC_10075 [Aquirufa sp.]|jgi:hypothetical protein